MLRTIFKKKQQIISSITILWIKVDKLKPVKVDKPKSSLLSISVPSLTKPYLSKVSLSSSSSSRVKEDNILSGVVVGLGPLLVVLVIGLLALQSTLSSIQAYRAQLEKEIAEAEVMIILHYEYNL